MTVLTMNEIFTPSTQPAWFNTLITNAVTLGLNTTSWRAGDPERVILTIVSYAAQYSDVIASGMNQGGFLDFAATGTVTFENADGTRLTVPVSPDPSDPSQNPTGAPTYLDALCEQNYNVPRIRFTNAGGDLALLNTSASTYGPFDAGTYHVSNEFTGAGYTNTASLSIAPSTAVGSGVVNATNDGGLVRIATSLGHGLVVGDVVFVTGVGGTTEANGAWYVHSVPTSTTITLRGSTFTNAYTSGGAVYRPTVATFTADEGGSVSSSYNADGVLDIHTVTQSVTALVGVSVSNHEAWVGTDTESNTALVRRAKLKLQSVSVNGPRGAYEFYALSSITYAPLLNPPQEMGAAITRARAVEDELSGHVYVFLANASGAPSSQDVEVTEDVIQAYCVPLAVTAEVFAATEVPVAVVLNVFLPAAFATNENKAVFQRAVQDYFAELDIGGESDPADVPAYINVLPYQDVIGAVYEAARDRRITIDNITGTLNGGTLNISLPVSTSSASVAVLDPVVPTVNLIPT